MFTFLSLRPKVLSFRFISRHNVLLIPQTKLKFCSGFGQQRLSLVDGRKIGRLAHPGHAKNPEEVIILLYIFSFRQ